jgi:hypothetical protein
MAVVSRAHAHSAEEHQPLICCQLLIMTIDIDGYGEPTSPTGKPNWRNSTEDNFIGNGKLAATKLRWHLPFTAINSAVSWLRWRIRWRLFFNYTAIQQQPLKINRQQLIQNNWLRILDS